MTLKRTLIPENKPTLLKRVFSREWLIPAGLILLSTIPVIAGSARIAEVTGGAEITPENKRFFDSPPPVIIHITSASVYAILGAFQFAPGFRRRRPRWHRSAGRLLIPLGLATSLTGLWMAHFYPWPEGDGELLYGLRLLFGSVMTGAILAGIVAIRQRKFDQHGAWMMRAYAIGVAAGTQAFTQLPWFLFVGTPSEFPRAVLMGAGWVINLAVAEWVIRNHLTRPRRRTRATISQQQ